MTTQDIYDSIIAEKESGNYPELDALNSTSKVSVWRLWVWIFAFASKTVQELFESFKTYIADVFAKSQAGTLNWWNVEIRKWQYGDALEFIDGIFKYAVIDNSKKIISQVAIEVLGGALVFKVGKDDGTGGLAPLTPVEQASLSGYISNIKFPGTFISVVSLPADDLILNYTIYYNAEYELSVITSAITTAAENYLSNLIFNGKFRHTELTDELQAIAGVKYPIFKSGFSKPDASPTADYIEFTDNYTASAGYFKIAELNLTMLPNV